MCIATIFEKPLSSLTKAARKLYEKPTSDEGASDVVHIDNTIEDEIMEGELAPNPNEVREACVLQVHMEVGSLASKKIKKDIMSDEDS